jgi:hypothetical protein
LFVSEAWRSDSPIQCHQLSADNIAPGFEFLSVSPLQGYFGFLSDRNTRMTNDKSAGKLGQAGLPIDNDHGAAGEWL